MKIKNKVLALVEQETRIRCQIPESDQNLRRTKAC